jgi:hypothetical protein
VIEEMYLPYLVLALNGDPIDTEALDRFAYDLHEQHRRKLGKSLGAINTALWENRHGTPGVHQPELVPIEALTSRSRTRRAPIEAN